jgi:energy-converting hydrogenase Eha subunit G
MRFIHLYLLGYFVLVMGAGLALWQAGFFHHVSAIWVLISALLIVGLGIVLAVTSVRPTTITRE